MGGAAGCPLPLSAALRDSDRHVRTRSIAVNAGPFRVGEGMRLDVHAQNLKNANTK